MEDQQREYALIVLVLFIVGLYALHNKAVVPFIMTVIHTRFFTGGDEADPGNWTLIGTESNVADQTES